MLDLIVFLIVVPVSAFSTIVVVTKTKNPLLSWEDCIVLSVELLEDLWKEF